MQRKYAILALALPTIGAFAILSWALVLPLVACLSEHSTNLKEYLGMVTFAHVTIFLFTIPAYVWVPLAIIGYVIGAWLVYSSSYRKRSFHVLLTGIVLSMFPIILLALAPLSKYRGP